MYAYYPLFAVKGVSVVTGSVTLPRASGDGAPPAGRTALADPGWTLPDVTLPGMVRPWAPDSRPPQHCGTPMAWRPQEPATMSSYSFEPADSSADLPALWRCRCGFQLDGIEQFAAGSAEALGPSR